MELIINLNGKDVDEKFIYEYLPKKMIEYIKLKYNVNDFISINNYLKNTLNIKEEIFELIREAINNLYIAKNNNQYIIKLEQNKLVNSNNEYKLSDIIYLCEYGNLQIQGKNIFIILFDFIKNNIDFLIDDYKNNF